MAEEPTKLSVRGESRPAAPVPAPSRDWPSFAEFRREMDRMFEDFGRDWFRMPSRLRMPDLEPMLRGALNPAVDVVESDGGYRITAELPGLDAKDVDISVSGDLLTVRGEKSETREETDKGTHVSERRYGSFQRAFSLPDSVDRDRIEAAFEKGVLTIKLPKSEAARAVEKKIEIKAA